MARSRDRRPRARSTGAPSPAIGQEAPPSPSLTRWLLAASVAVALTAYWNALGAGLVRDAAALVLDDPRIRALGGENLWRIAAGEYWWEKATGPLYRPLTTLSFLLQYVVHGERPFGYHAVNVALHAGNAMLVGVLVRRLKGGGVAALSAAALFAAHPIATEAVANVAGRADLLAAAGVLAAVWLHAADRPVGLFTAALAGLLAKENAIVVAPLVVLFDAIVRRTADASPRWRWRSYVAVAAAVAIGLVARGAALADVEDPGVSFADNPLTGLSALGARLTALKVLSHAVGLLLWPATLSADYSYDHIPLFPWGRGAEDVKLATAVAALVGLAAFAAVRRAKAPAAAFLAAFLVLALLPTSNLFVLIGTVFAERFLYLPLAAFAGGAGLALEAVLGRTPAASMPRRAVVAIAGLLLALAVMCTHARNRDWHDDEALFRSARVAAPRSYRAHKGLAQALLVGAPDDARLDEAIGAAEEAVRILETRPPEQRSADTALLLGMAYMNKGDRVAQRDPEAAYGWYVRAREVLERGAETDRAQSRDPRRGLARLYDVLGNTCMRLAEPRAAAAHFETFRRLVPARSVGYMLSGWALGQQGRLDEATVLTLEAWLIDQRSDARAILEELYRQRDVAGRIFRDDAALADDNPAVRDDVRRACAALDRDLADAPREVAARVASRCGRARGGE